MHIIGALIGSRLHQYKIKQLIDAIPQPKYYHFKNEHCPHLLKNFNFPIHVQTSELNLCNPPIKRVETVA
jgi:hypothetical protein